MLGFWVYLPSPMGGASRRAFLIQQMLPTITAIGQTHIPTEPLATSIFAMTTGGMYSLPSTPPGDRGLLFRAWGGG